MEFFERTGKMALGSRLRMLAAKVTEDASAIYGLYDVDLQPKWFPAFYILSNDGQKTIGEIAVEIGHSQPSVSKIVKEMLRKGIVVEKKGVADGRTTVIGLSKKGEELANKIKDQYTDVNQVIEAILSSTTHSLWRAIEEWEYILQEKSLLVRVKEAKKKRESNNVKIVAYKDEYSEAFKQLNVEWISKYFKMEAADHKVLKNPRASIIDKGGHIFVALYKGVPSGVCALLQRDHPRYKFELAKMAVAPHAQGLNIGFLLGQATIKKAKSLGAKSLYIESNTILKPAISLYQKLGFLKVTGEATPYERCNIQMALTL